jgi:hypothetical protein
MGKASRARRRARNAAADAHPAPSTPRSRSTGDAAAGAKGRGRGSKRAVIVGLVVAAAGALGGVLLWVGTTKLNRAKALAEELQREGGVVKGALGPPRRVCPARGGCYTTQDVAVTPSMQKDTQIRNERGAAIAALIFGALFILVGVVAAGLPLWKRFRTTDAP